MAKMFKLVTQRWTTYNYTMKWDIGVTNKANGEGIEMCSDQVLHCYADPRLAILFNSAHANITSPRLLEIECSDIVATDGMKHACKEQTPIREIDLPYISLIQRQAFAILCALEVEDDPAFVVWANNWLSGKDRSGATAAVGARADLLRELTYRRYSIYKMVSTGLASFATGAITNNLMSTRYIEIIDQVMQGDYE